MTIYFNGKPVDAREGDTVASALYRAGRRIFTRSFKFHRRRGLLCLTGRCPNCLMNVDGIPNVRACVTPVCNGMRVRHQNAWPSLDFDALAIAGAFGWLMPVGWYYKIFTHPRVWRAVAPFIRRIAGLGDPPPPAYPAAEYEHVYRHTDVAVIGGGPAGLQAARAAAGRGEQVVLVDDGGSAVADTIADQVELIQPASCFGLYEGGLLGISQPNPHPGARERLIHLRARRIVVATGAYEAPLSFGNNDLPGVMLSSAVERLVRRHGIVPGKRAVVIGTGVRAEETATVLRTSGVSVVATVTPESVIRARGARQVRGIVAREANFSCDLVVMCGHRIPDSGLITQAGGRIDWSPAAGAFVPVNLPPHVTVAGAVSGNGLAPAATLPSAVASKHAFVCLCSDVTARDLRDGIAEGFDQIETLKRYSTATMGPCQGKMCQLPSIGICADATGRGMSGTGTTTARPPNPGISLGALAGPRHHPVRRTPMHYEHAALGAVWLDMGEWKRPRFYRSLTSSGEKQCVAEEYDAVRRRAGLIDVSTLGKLDVKGRDAGRLLDKVYINRLSDLRVGRVRYAAICDEAGILLDDGTVARMADDHWFLTTTTGNLDFVQQWLEWWLVGSGWEVHITNVTAGFAAMNLAGPEARAVLRKLTDCDLDSAVFPYMAARRAEVAGVPAILLRIGFVGETGWEIHVPAESGSHLWTALLEAGAPFGIRPFGVEAQRLLRLEKRHVIVGVDTDALTGPFDAGMGRLVQLDKADFIGKAALARQNGGSAQTLVGFTMLEDVVPEDGAAVLVNGDLGGRVTSTRYSPGIGRAIGLAWAPAAAGEEGSEISIRVAGRAAKATVTPKAFYDPEGARLRM